MNYLELCNKLHEKTGESGADLTTVSGQTGYYKKITEYIKDAWVDIQSKHTTWRFLRKSALPTIAASSNSIDAESWVSSNLSLSIDYIHIDTFSIYDTSKGVSDESPLIYVPWEHWKYRFGISYADGVEGRPVHITIDPSTGNLIVGPTSDGAYTIGFEFQAVPVELATDSDVPAITKNMHMIIVWHALERYGSREESKIDVVDGRREYRRMMRRLQTRELEQIRIGKTLA